MKGFLLTLLIFWIISRFVKKNVTINTFNSYNQQAPDNASSRKREGEMSIDKGSRSKPKNKKDKDDDGEFVDYEEVK